MRSAIIENGKVKNVILGQVKGSVPCPREVGKGWLYDGSSFTRPAPYVEPPLSIEEKRANAYLQKDDFILAALDLGVLSETDAEEATNGWPTGWDAFFDGQPARARIEAKAKWAAAVNIHRNAPLIEALATFKSLTPEQVDALFGIE